MHVIIHLYQDVIVRGTHYLLHYVIHLRLNLNIMHFWAHITH